MELNKSFFNFNNYDQLRSEIIDDDYSFLSLSLLNKESKSSNSFSKKNLFESSSDESTEEGSIEIKNSKKYKNNSIYKKTPKSSLFKKKLRKDIHGNLIEKGGKQKVSFKDDIKGKYLVELTFYSQNDNCLKRKSHKNYTYQRRAKDKEAIDSQPCNIF